MKIHPLADRIVVKPLEAESKTSGGIVLPDTAKEKSTRGEVIAVGRGRVTNEGKLIEPRVKKGDVVLYSKYGGTEFKLDGVEYRILSESEIYAVVEGK